MRGPIAWFVRNPVAANLLMLSIVVGGLLSIGLPRTVTVLGRTFELPAFLTTSSIEREIFPEFSTDTILVTVPYPGATPEEVEEAINIRVEEEVAGIDGVERIASTASEGVGIVTIELLEGTDVAQALDDVKARVDAIDTFPVDAEAPTVDELRFRRQVINVAVSGDVDERSLKRVGERVRDEIAGLEGITQVELVSARDWEISIEVSEAALRRHDLTFDAVADAVRRGSLDLSGGTVKTAAGEILLRTTGQAYRGEEFAAIAVTTAPDGTRVTVGDVATVVDGFAEVEQATRFDGRPAVLVQVFRVGDQDALEIAELVHDYCATAEAWLPEGITLTPWLDQAELLRSRQDLMLRNGLNGFLLVFLVLGLFLRPLLAVWVSLGIPIAFLGTLWLMPHLDVSINMLSLFAFIIVLGIVVDDAIMVGENVHTQTERGRGGAEAAIEGTRQISVPVVFAVLTTVAAFVPMLTVPGTTGSLWAVIPAIVIPTLLVSLVEAHLILPAHLRHLRPLGTPRRGPRGWWPRFQRRFAKGLAAFVTRVYQPSLELTLRHRYVTLAAAVALLCVTIGLVAGGHVKFVFFPAVDGDNVVATLTMPQGTPFGTTTAAVERLERAALRLREEFAPEDAEGSDPIRHVLSSIGEQPYRKMQEEGAGNVLAVGFSGDHYGEVNVQLAPSETRSFASEAVEKRWRELIGPLPAGSELEFSASLIDLGADVEVRLAGQDLDMLQAAAEVLKDELRTFEGVFEVSDSFDEGKEQIELRLRPEAETLGVTLRDLARQMRQGFYGEEAQRIQRGRDEVAVMVRYPEAERRSLADVEALRIRTPAGEGVPFATVADAEFGRSHASIRRHDRQRTISVTGSVDDDVTTVDAVVARLEADVLPALQARFPGLSASFEGEQREQQESLGGLAEGFVAALLMIFALLAVPLRSYVQPLIVMSAIPFGLIGAILGHLVMGMPLSVLSMCGIVALSGVVVNDSLVLVDFVNRRRAGSDSLRRAVREAGAARFRPVVLTSLTTFAGLTPLLFEKSVQALFLVPMAISLGFGVLFATGITLVLVPASYLILDDLVGLGRRAGRAVGRLYGRPGRPATPAEA